MNRTIVSAVVWCGVACCWTCAAALIYFWLYPPGVESAVDRTAAMYGVPVDRVTVEMTRGMLRVAQSWMPITAAIMFAAGMLLLVGETICERLNRVEHYLAFRN